MRDGTLLRAGDLIDGRYRLTRLLGSGGMAEVWEARHEILDREIAIKLVRVADGGIVERLRAEAKALARLAHPAIVRVFDAGTASSDTPFLALELVRGESLERRLERGPLNAADAAGLVIEVCDGLAAAHAASVIHRDVKPSNILLPAEAPHRPKIVDFGVAALTGALDARLTRAGAIVGTPAYMAPEQLRGEQPDARTDVWGASVTLFEAVFGCLPFRADDIRALMTLILTREIERPSSAAIDDGLWQIIRAGLAKDRAQRHQSAETLAAALRRWRGGARTSFRDLDDDADDVDDTPSFDALVKRRLT